MGRSRKFVLTGECSSTIWLVNAQIWLVKRCQVSKQIYDSSPPVRTSIIRSIENSSDYVLWIDVISCGRWFCDFASKWTILQESLRSDTIRKDWTAMLFLDTTLTRYISVRIPQVSQFMSCVSWQTQSQCLNFNFNFDYYYYWTGLSFIFRYIGRRIYNNYASKGKNYRHIIYWDERRWHITMYKNLSKSMQNVSELYSKPVSYSSGHYFS